MTKISKEDLATIAAIIGAIASILGSLKALISVDPLFGWVALAFVVAGLFWYLTQGQRNVGIISLLAVLALVSLGAAWWVGPVTVEIATYIDENRNGVRDAFEQKGPAGIEVQLLDSEGVMRVAYTDDGGDTTFHGVPQGHYGILKVGPGIGGIASRVSRTAPVAISPTPQPPTDTPTPIPTAIPTNTPTSTPMPTATLTNTPTLTPLPEPDAIVVAPVNLRSGPGTMYDIISTLSPDQVLSVTGCNDDASWLQVNTDQMQEGWVINRADLVTLNLPTGQIPIVPTPIPPTLTPIPTSTPLPEPMATPTPILTPSPATPPPAPAPTQMPLPTTPPPAPAPTHTPIATPTSTPVPVISIIKPAQKVPCPLTGDCVFPVEGTSTNVVTSLQTIVIFVDPGGGKWWPQNLDFPPPTIQASGDWEGKAKIGVGPQPSGTEFNVIALLMNRTQVPTEKQECTTLPPSITMSSPIHVVCDTCFYVNIVSPQGTHNREDAPSFPVSNTVEISWEPSECVMIVQCYQNNELKGEHKSVTSGTEINVGAPGSGETEIKIWREGFEEQSDNIWVWVE